MRYLLVLILITALGSCADAPQEQRPQEGDSISGAAPSGEAIPPAATPGKSADVGLVRLSTRETNRGSAAEGNLCKVSFDETSALFPLENNPDGRSFDMRDSGGVYVVIITASNSKSTFMLEPCGNYVSLLSSEQAPECLSRKLNFFVNESRDGFLYDGGKYIKYQFTVSKTNQGFKGTLNWDPGKVYGVRVRSKNSL
jgi:hypothetical protein